jgi:hypothetical protein
MLESYEDKKLCPSCNRNAAVKIRTTGREPPAYGTCRLCSTKEDELDVADYIWTNSALAIAQELDGAPPLSKEEKKNTSIIVQGMGGWTNYGKKIVDK